MLDLTEWVERTYPARRTHAKLVEDKANGPAVISQLRRRVPGLIAVDPQGDKVARARAVAPDVEAGRRGSSRLPSMGAPSRDTGTRDSAVRRSAAQTTLKGEPGRWS